ncbi:MAG: macro domain-containing protein [Clostridiales bacterium]|nr:macro domain-containing protein [Candidatus Crickella caballi]
MSLQIIFGDISQMNTDAVVLPANPELLEGPGSSEAIFTAAGAKELAAACSEIGYCPLGDAVITSGFNLKARYIIHAVCPRYTDGTHKERELLYSTYQAALRLATENGLESISFPMLSAGSYCFPRGEALETAKEAISDYLESIEDELLVQLVIYDREDLRKENRRYDDVRDYVSRNWIGVTGGAVYESAGERLSMTARKLPDGRLGAPARESLDELSSAPALNAELSFDNIIKQEKKSFLETLMEYIIRSELKNSQIYNRANISKQVFSKTISGQSKPTKQTICALAIALELSLDETEELLMKAGYAFSDAIVGDLIVRYFIETKHYDIFDLNIALFDYDQPTLN